MSGFIFVERDMVKKVFPEFQQTLQEAEQRALSSTKTVWPGLTYGGLTPKENQFGRTNILPMWFADEAGDVLDKNHSPSTWGVNSFNIYYSSTSPSTATIPGWKTILQGGNAANVGITPEDVRIIWVGLAFASPTLNISKIRFEIGDTRYPIIDIEELHTFEKPTLIFEKAFIIPEETHFLLKGFFEASGYQRVIPLGFAYYRRKDTVITE